MRHNVELSGALKRQQETYSALPRPLERRVMSQFLGRGGGLGIGNGRSFFSIWFLMTNQLPVFG